MNGSGVRSRRAAGRGVVRTVMTCIACTPAAASAQADTVTVRASARYEVDVIEERLLGRGYRDLWSAPMRVEVLDLDRFAGGLEPLRAGGGHQTRTLHLTGADGRRYIFRSMEKDVERVLPVELAETPLGNLMQDHMSALHPTGALAVPPLLRAAGVLHVQPRLAVMPDHPRLGEHREEFAGMLGTIEERPDEADGGPAAFAGATDVIGMETMLERMDDDPAHRAHSRDWLAARLVDFLIGDTDRGADQWRWALVDMPAGSSTAPAGSTAVAASGAWRPVPRDRDWAFIRSTGVLPGLARMVFPKLVAFGPSWPSVNGLVFSSIHLDRRVLADLDGATFDSVAVALQRRIDDDVIERAIASLPPEHRAIEGDAMRAALRARRDRLPDIAARFHAYLARDVDVHGTAQDDLALVDVLDDGSVRVRLLARSTGLVAATGDSGTPPAPTPWFDRRFVPDLTRSIRIHLGPGGNYALVRGAAPTPIAVHITGGPGNDVYVDSTRSARGADVAFHDDSGSDTFVTGPRTRIDTRPFSSPGRPDDWIGTKVMRYHYRDWGATRSIRPTLTHEDGAGFVVGLRATDTDYGFRRVPFARRIRLETLLAPGARGGPGFGLRADVDYTRENSPWRLVAEAEAFSFDSFRFYGFGNDTPAPPSHDDARIRQSRLGAAAGLRMTTYGGFSFGAGLRADHLRPDPGIGSPLALDDPFGSRHFTAASAWIDGGFDTTDHDELPTRGFRIAARAAAAPPVLGVDDPFADAAVTASTYLTFGPTLALRAGAARAWGGFPVQLAPAIGGRRSLRGFRSRRFTGDAAVFAAAELRAPLGRIPTPIRARFGLLAFTDAGRVFLHGDSPGGWHTGTGAGIWFEALGSALAATVARGEERRFNLSLGMPF